MSPPDSSSNDLPPAPSDSTKHHHTLAEHEREAIAVARRHFEGSWLQHVAARLKTVDFVNSIVVIGAALLL